MIIFNSIIKKIRAGDINLESFETNFINYVFIFSFFILNFLILLILLPPYSHVEYGTKIYEFTSTNMHLFDDKLFYILNFILSPILSILILNGYQKNKFMFLSVVAINIFLLFLLINAFSIFYFYYLKKNNFSLGNYNLFYIFILFEILIFFIINEKNKKKFIDFYDRNQKKIFLLFLIFSIFLACFYSPFNFIEIDKFKFFYDIKLFFENKFSIIIFFIFTFLIFFLIKFENNLNESSFYKNFKYVILFLILFFHLFYFDSSFEMNLHHYSPLYGPALHFKNTLALPGVEAHSQYGYIFFIILRYIFEIFPDSFGTTGLLIRVINVLTLFMIILIFFRLSKQKILSLLFATIFIAFHFKNAIINFSSFPSLLGLRNLIPLISLFFLINLQEKKIFSLSIIFLICLSSITSFEVFIYTLFPYLSFILLIKLSRKEFTDVWLIIGKIFFSIIIFHLAINIIYLIFLNKIIDYEIYFEILKSMAISRWWPVPTLNLFFVPYIYFLIYGVSMIYCYHLLIKIWNKDLNEENYLNFKLFFSITSLGILMMIYYVSRSLPSNLHVVSIPLYFLIYLFFEKFIINKIINFKFYLLINLIIIYFVFSASSWIGSPINAYKNTNLLFKKCFPNLINCEISKYINNLTNKYHNYPEESHENKILISANKIIEKFYKNENNILFFSYDYLSAIPEATFGKNEKWYFHPISYVYSDELSQKKKDQIFEMNSSLKEDQLITILKSKNIQRLEREIIDKIKEEWYLCNIGFKDKYFEIFKMSKNEC